MEWEGPRGAQPPGHLNPGRRESTQCNNSREFPRTQWIACQGYKDPRNYAQYNGEPMNPNSRPHLRTLGPRGLRSLQREKVPHEGPVITTAPGLATATQHTRQSHVSDRDGKGLPVRHSDRASDHPRVGVSTLRPARTQEWRPLSRDVMDNNIQLKPRSEKVAGCRRQSHRGGRQAQPQGARP